MRVFLRSKIHKATVTEANLAYVGSITIDRAVMEEADVQEFEKVLIVDNTNGVRLETYAIPGERNSGVICINGAAAHLVNKGDEVIVMTFEVTNNPRPPIVVLLDEKNRVVRRLEDPVAEEGVLEGYLYS